jgi:hypothetical protein
METKRQVVKAMALIRRPRDGALLVSEGADPSGALFHRPLGGHVEFGEYALDTVHRDEPVGGRDGEAGRPGRVRWLAAGPWYPAGAGRVGDPEHRRGDQHRGGCGRGQVAPG